MSLLSLAPRTLCACCRHAARTRRYASAALAFAQKESDPSDAERVSGSPSTPAPRQRSRKHATDKASQKPARDFSEPTIAERYLDSLAASGHEPSVEDLERLKPRHDPAQPDTKLYAQQYNSLVDDLSRKFSKDQLYQFAKMLKLGPIDARGRRKKIEYAESIIERHWLWPSLKEVEKLKRDRTEVGTKSFPFTAQELFLVLGKDGADLLHMSNAFNVHISIAQSPLALRVEGVRNSLRSISEYIKDIRATFVRDTFDLPTQTPLSEPLLQRISRLSAAFIENVDKKGQIRIHAKSSADLTSAHRLACHAACTARESSRVPLLAHLPHEVPSRSAIPLEPRPNMYSLYPFFSHRSLPWTMSTGGAFRVRRLGDWLQRDVMEDINITGGLAGGKGRTVDVTDQLEDVRAKLLSRMPQRPEDCTVPSRTITASTGHLLFSASEHAARATLVPPLAGHWSFHNILRWARNGSVRPNFIPSLPVALTNSAPGKQRTLRRLVYHARPRHSPSTAASATATESAPTHFIKWEAIIETDALFDTFDPVPSEKLALAPDNEVSGVEGLLSNAAGSEALFSDSASNEVWNCANSAQSYRCWHGSQADVDLLLPTRPMDMRLSVTDSTFFAPEAMPEELQRYRTELESLPQDEQADLAQPLPPLRVFHNDSEFILVAHQSVRQGVEYMVNQPESVSDTSEDIPDVPPLRVVSESILDLESRQKSASCKVESYDTHSAKSWNKLMMDCDHLTSMAYRPANSGLLGALDTRMEEVPL